MLGRAADLGDALMTAQGEGTIHPAEAGRGRDEHLGILRAEEGVAFTNGVQDLERAFGFGGGMAEFLELLVRPIIEQHLFGKFILAGGDDCIEIITIAEFTQLGVVMRVEFEAFAIFGLEIGKLIEFRQRRDVSAEIDGSAFLEDAASRALRELAHFAHEQILRAGSEEAFRGVEAASFVAAFLEHAGRGEIAEDVVAIGRDPEVERADGLFDEGHIIGHDFAGEPDERQVVAELPDGHRRVVVIRELLSFIEFGEHGLGAVRDVRGSGGHGLQLFEGEGLQRKAGVFEGARQ